MFILACVFDPHSDMDGEFPLPPGWGVIDSTPLLVTYTDTQWGGEQVVVYSLMHWALVRECICKDLHSNILKMVGMSV